MRELPLGLPKLMVSTLASGDVSPYVGVSDIVMMPSITDMAGLNRISRVVLANAAQAIVGMATNPPPASSDGKPAIGLTMFGVTTPCVTEIVERLKPTTIASSSTPRAPAAARWKSSPIAGLLSRRPRHHHDGSLRLAVRRGAARHRGSPRRDRAHQTALCRLGRRARHGQFLGAGDDAGAAAQARLFYQHNSNVTLMRTTAEECRAIGEWIGKKLNACEGPVRFLIPEKGVSALDIEGGAFWDPEADAALFEALEATVRQSANRRIDRLPLHINDPEFAEAAVAAFQ